MEWIGFVFAGIVALAFVCAGVTGVVWVIRNTAWLSIKGVAFVLTILGYVARATIRATTVVTAEAARIDRPYMRQSRTPVTPRIVLIRILVVALVFVSLYFLAGKTWTLPKMFEPEVGSTPLPRRGNSPSSGAKDITGANFGNSLFADYTGISGVVPANVSVDFCAQLDSLWDRKQRRSGNNFVVSQTRKILVPQYCSTPPTLMSVGAYREKVDEIVAITRNNLNWAKVAQIEVLDPRRLHVVRGIVNSFTGDDLVAYAMTELMPSTDGGLNLRVLDFLLKNGGREYVEAIPALYDPYTSFGPYQFTQFAWYDVGNERRGGSLINQALQSPIGHGSVMQLRGDEHHSAALLFAIHNLAFTTRRLDNQQLTALEKSWKPKHDSLVQFVAVAHHAPYGAGGAQGALSRWLTNGTGSDFSRSLSGRLVGYAHKTRANLAALRNN